MSEREHTSGEDTLARLHRIDALCDRFEALLGTDRAASVDAFLRAEGVPPEGAGPDLLLELRRVDEAYRATPAAGASGTWPGPGRPHDTAAPEAGDAVAEAGAPDPPVVPGYEILGLLDTGGMGAVYRARELSLGRDVVVKVLKDRPASAAAAARFAEEARLTGHLQHPAIPPVFELGALADGSPFLAMKLIRGETLRDRLARRAGPADGLPGLVAVFEQVCQGVAYAHSRGVVHRDLKPGNVMVGAHGEVQVMDWGLAKVLDRDADASTGGAAPDGEPSAVERSRTGSVLGTPAYMPPEQARGEVGRVDRRSDVFGLGGVLCAVLTGSPPHTGGTAAALRAARDGDLTAAYARLGGCGGPPELVALCKRCLSAAQADRPADAGAVAEAVARFRADADERARRAEQERAAAGARAAEQRKRRRTQLALAAAVGLLLAGAAAFAWWEDRRAVRRDAERRAEAAAVLDTADEDVKHERWSAAADRSARAEGLLNGLPDASPLHDRLRQLKKDLAMVARLDAIRFDTPTAQFIPPDHPAVQAYAEAFREYGIDEQELAPAEAAGRVRGSAIRARLIDAVDHWLWLRESFFNVDRRGWVLAVARLCVSDERWKPLYDYDPAVGRRDIWENRRPALDALAAHPEVATLPRSVGLRLARLLGVPVSAERRAKTVEVLYKLHARHPDDFWLNLELGRQLSNRPAEAVGHFQAALAVRPDDPDVLIELGKALVLAKRPDQAIACARRAIDLQAVKPADRRVLRVVPSPYNLLGRAYVQKRHWDEAIANFQHYARLYEKGSSSAASYLCLAHINTRDWKAAHDQWKLTFNARSVTTDIESAYVRAALLLLTGDEPGYRQQCAATLETWPSKSSPKTQPRDTYLATRLCGLGSGALPEAQLLELAEWARGFDKAPSASHAAGLAYYRAGRLAEARQFVTDSMKSKPAWSADVCNWLLLAMVDHGKDPESAKKLFDRACAWIDGPATKAGTWMPHDPDQFHVHDWLSWHLLRREAAAVLSKPASPALAPPPREKK